MSGPRVFVVQEHLTKVGERLEPKFDMSDAQRYGQLCYLLGASAAPWTPSVALQLHQALQHYEPTRDFLLLTGNPVLIGMVCAVAAQYGKGKLAVLQWDGRNRKYVPLTVDTSHSGAWDAVWDD